MDNALKSHNAHLLRRSPKTLMQEPSKMALDWQSKWLVCKAYLIRAATFSPTILQHYESVVLGQVYCTSAEIIQALLLICLWLQNNSKHNHVLFSNATTKLHAHTQIMGSLDLNGTLNLPNQVQEFTPLSWITEFCDHFVIVLCDCILVFTFLNRRFDLQGGNSWFPKTSNANEGDLMCTIGFRKLYSEVQKKFNLVISNLLNIERNMMSNGLEPILIIAVNWVCACYRGWKNLVRWT